MRSYRICRRPLRDYAKSATYNFKSLKAGASDLAEMKEAIEFDRVAAGMES